MIKRRQQPVSDVVKLLGPCLLSSQCNLYLVPSLPLLLLLLLFPPPLRLFLTPTQPSQVTFEYKRSFTYLRLNYLTLPQQWGSWSLMIYSVPSPPRGFYFCQLQRCPKSCLGNFESLDYSTLEPPRFISRRYMDSPRPWKRAAYQEAFQRLTV